VAGARPRRRTRKAPARLVERRIGLLFAVFLALLGAATLRAGYLFAFKGAELRQRATTQQVQDTTVPAKRGAISDRHGKELAVSEDAATVYATPYLIKDPTAASKRIAPLLGKSEQDLFSILADRRRGFAYLARKLDIRRAHRIKKLKIEGIGLLDDERRYYPEGSLASQVLGTVGIDNQGLSGLELDLDGELRGSDGEQRVVKDALGDPVSLNRTRGERSGRDVRLTIDSALQDRTEAVLGEVGRAYQPKGATAIVMNPRNGDLLAMANWPEVNANRVEQAPPWARANRAIGFTYEPGSTFKSITVAGALQEGLVKPETTFTIGPQIQVADRVIKEAHGTGGVFTVSRILAQSSNVGAVKVGLMLGAKRFDRWVRRFGFGELTNVPLPGESEGIVPQVKDYSGSSIGNLPIGQGLAVTPIQMAAAYSAIANGGVLVKPRLVMNGADSPVGRRVISYRTARRLESMLEGVLGPTGTAPEAAVAGYDIAGKTGTAEKAVAGGYSQSRFVASFIGFAPARDARLLVAVMVDEPKGSHTGGEVAAPAFERIATFALPYLGIAPK
jgi:cell division protein FtsI (penicillin-binding protein 3)